VTGWANDSSGYSIYLSGDDQDPPENIVVLDNGGNQVYPSVIDRYGNYWSMDSNGNLVDDLGRTPVIATQNDNVTYYDVLTVGGARARYTVTYASVQMHTAFNEQAVTEWSGTLNAVQSIELPDGSQYSFTYDSGTSSGHYGELTSVTLPTGGTVQYGWSNYFDSYQNVNRWLASRTLGSGQTTFTPSVLTQCSSGGTGCQEQVRMTRPSGDEALYVLTLNNGAWNTTTSYYNGSVASGTLQVTTQTGYNFSIPCDSSCTGSALITKSSETSSYGSAGWNTQTQYVFDNPQLGKPSKVKQWDFYGGSLPSIPNRETDYAYSGFDMTSETLLDSQGSTAAFTQYQYGSTAIATSGIVNHGSVNGGGPFLQSIIRWINTSNTYLTTSFNSYDTGSVHTITDPRQHMTTLDYDSTQTFVQTTTRPTTQNGVAHIATASYDFSSGFITRIDDENSHAQGSIYPTTYSYYTSGSNIGRLMSVSPPQAGATQYSYPSANEVDTSTAQSSSVNLTTQDITDSYGRQIQHVGGSVATQLSYDANGRVYCRTSPYFTWRSSATDGSTCYSYDGLDRPTQLTNPDGTATTIQYNAFSTYVWDELQQPRQYNHDVFGNLSAVFEPNPSGQLVWLTYYSYNALDEMVQAVQEGDSSQQSQWRTRTWSFDSLGRPIDEKTPEQGWLCFGAKSGSTCQENYDPNGNLMQQTDADNHVVNYTYDELDRPLTVQSSGISNSYFYDVSSLPDGTATANAVGRLAAEYVSSNATNVYSYHPMGWVVTKSGWTPAHPTSAGNAVQLNHDLAGNVTSITYPDGRTLSQQFDSDGRLSQVQDAGWNNNAVYWSNPSYYPAGGLARARFGNGVQTAAGFNKRGAITSLSYATSTGTALWGRSYAWANNAMNLVKSTDLATGVATTYTYDNLNRLTSANQPTACSVTGFTESYTLDAWGNLKQSGNFSFMPSSYSALNQVPDTGYVYDAAGNMTRELIPGVGSRTYQYDALNQLTDNAAGATYTYDAEGNRIRKVSGSAVKEYVWVGGQLLATYDPNANAWQDLIYAGGQFLAEVAGTQNAVANYRLSDHLGSLVMLTNNAGSAIGTYTYTPYGQLLSSTGTPDAYMFTGLEWDSEINSYHAGYRQMMGVEGRWLTADPYRGSYDWGNPQSLNRYGYVLGNPLAFTDPTGQFAFCGVSGAGVEGGLALSGPIGWVALAGCAGALIDQLLGLRGPKFHGSLKPRPSANPWNDKWGVPYGGLGSSIGQAMGLPTGGCEFGACGPAEGFMRGPGPWHNDATLIEKLNYIAWAVHLANMSGVSDDIINCIITEKEDPDLDPYAHDPSGGGFGAVGFMQVRLVSLNDVNRREGLVSVRYRESDLYDPGRNIMIGTLELRNHIEAAHGDVWKGIKTWGTNRKAYVNKIKKCSGEK